MKVVLIILSIIPTVLITIIPFFGKISDNRRKGLKKFTRRGYLLITCCVFGSFASASLILWEDYENRQNEDNLKENINNLNRELYVRDSINKTYKDSTDMRLYEAFAKYGLKYDQSQQKISRLIRDSAKTTIISADKPYLTVKNIKLTQTSPMEIQFTIGSEMATSYKIKIRFDYVIFDSVNISYHKFIENFDLYEGTEVDITKGYENTKIVTIPSYPNIKSHYFHIYGTYESSDGFVLPFEEYLYKDSYKPELHMLLGWRLKEMKNVFEKL